MNQDSPKHAVLKTLPARGWKLIDRKKLSCQIIFSFPEALITDPSEDFLFALKLKF
jgi:hypothetical protein